MTHHQQTSEHDGQGGDVSDTFADRLLDFERTGDVELLVELFSDDAQFVYDSGPFIAPRAGDSSGRNPILGPVPGRLSSLIR